MKKYNAILFDLDGTLLDTANDLISAFRKCSIIDAEHISDDELIEVIGTGSKDVYKLLEKKGINFGNFDKFRETFINNYRKQGHTQTFLFPGMESVIYHLDETEQTWGIVTNKYYAGALDTLKHFPELGNYHCLIGADSAAYAKPAPEPLLMACDILETQPEDCLFVGDTVIDMEAAHHANMDFALASYGYGKVNTSNSRWNINYTLNKVEDLLELL